MRRPDFETLYQHDADPFDVATSWYERRKEAVLLSSLTREHYASAWDAACGTGHLAHALGERCDRVLATDASPTAVRLTADRTRDAPRVRALVSRLPVRPVEAAAVELTVVAEVLYYLSDEERARTRSMLRNQAGELVSVHWRHHPDDAYLSGAAATEELDADLTSAGWTAAWRHDDTDFAMAGWWRYP
jgi:trans-aconitate methyltransferase